MIDLSMHPQLPAFLRKLDSYRKRKNNERLRMAAADALERKDTEIARLREALENEN